MEPEIELNYPEFQATWHKGEFNFTVRGTEASSVYTGLQKMIDAHLKNPASIGTQSAQQNNKSVKCQTCGSSMHYKTFTSKQGKQIEVYECDNTNCKNEDGYRTSIFASKVK